MEQKVRNRLIAGAIFLLAVVILVVVVPRAGREKPRAQPRAQPRADAPSSPKAKADFAIAPPGVGEPVATDGYPQRAYEGEPRPWRPPPMPPFEGPRNPDPPLTELGRDSLGDWMGYDDPYNSLKNLEDSVRPGASTWFRAGRGWADAPGSYEGSSASALSAYMVAT